jgi:hypothetical protein
MKYDTLKIKNTLFKPVNWITQYIIYVLFSYLLHKLYTSKPKKSRCSYLSTKHLKTFSSNEAQLPLWVQKLHFILNPSLPES